MAIVFPVDVPLEEFADVDVRQINVNSIQVATFTGQDRIQEFEGDWWALTMSYRNLGPALGRQVSGFLASLRGTLGTFVVRYPGYGNSFGLARENPSSPLVAGGGQASNRVLNIKSAPPSLTGWLRTGDIIQVGPDTRPHWHEVLQDVDTAADGTATLEIWPSLRITTTDNDPIVTFEPKGLCRLTQTPTKAVRPPVITSVTINAREVTGD